MRFVLLKLNASLRHHAPCASATQAESLGDLAMPKSMKNEGLGPEKKNSHVY